MALTDAKIRNAKAADKPFKLTDSHGLYLEVRPNGAKLWRYRYRIGGRENVFAVGDYRDMGLSEARDERKKARDLVKQGIHPARQRKADRARQAAENANTFKAVAQEWIEKRRTHWTPTYCKQIENTLKSDVYPAIGAHPIRSVTAAQILEILEKMEKRGAETAAIMMRQWISAIYRYAVSTLRADADPAAALKGAVKRPKVRHHPPLAQDEIPKFLEAVEKYGGFAATKHALRLLLLTFTRTIELRAAKWEEIDLENAEWRIPAERMKMREPHFVPLATQAVEELIELKQINGSSPWLFPNHRRPRECMTGTTINRALERMGYGGKFSAHGFRSTASTVLNELGYRPDVIERQLAHTERNKVRASYNRAEYLDERRQMMQAWADYLYALRDNMVPIRARKQAG